MEIEFQLVSSLPRLAWCARLRKNQGVVRILHGPWVETRNDCFFEGAWDGPFDAYRFDEAITMSGTGGRIVDGSILFVSPGHTYESLHSIRLGGELHVSNSLAFLLANTDRRLAIRHPYYFFDFLNHYRNGIRNADKRISIQDRHNVSLHDCCNFMVQPDLTITRFDKKLIDPPADFTNYVAFLESTVNAVCENSAHPSRTQTYRPVTTISQGYDSTAAAALASRAGCREAVTFRKSGSKDYGYVDDSGIHIGRYLDLETTEYERMDFKKLTGLPTTEFYLNPFTITDTLAVMEDQLVGAQLLTGLNGDYVWGKDHQSGLPLLQRPNVVDLTSGNNMSEFRLRVGFIHLPVPFCGALRGPSIHKITRSQEMKTWSRGSKYDRPIARRIAEEAGVPGELFGQRKIGGPWPRQGYDLAPADELDFNDFYQSEVNQNPAGHQPVRGRRRAQKRIVKWLRPLGKLLGPSAHRYLRFFINDRLDPRWGSRYLFRFHWGFERTRERYQSALGEIMADYK